MAEQRELIYRLKFEVESAEQAAKRLKQELDGVVQSENAAAAAADGLGDSLNNTVNGIRNQIKELKKQRDQTEIGSEAFVNYNVKIKDLESNLKQATSATSVYGNAQQQTAEQTRALAKLQEDQARSAGLAGAATFELGRFVSDLPFGLVAVSNNLSQMGTLFAALVANAGGFSKALGFIKAQLLNPVTGLLIAFQVVTAAITFFAQRSNKAKEEVSDLNLELESQALILQEIIRLKKEGAITSAEEERLLNNYVNINKELVNLSKEGVISDKEKNQILKETLRLFQLRETSDKAQRDRDEQRKDIAEDIVNLEKDREKAVRKLNKEIDLGRLTPIEIEARQREINKITAEILLKESQKLDIVKEEADEKSKIGLIQDEINKKIDDAVKKQERLLQIEKERASAISELLSEQVTQEQESVDESILQQDEAKFLRHYSKLLELKQFQLEQQRLAELKDVKDQTTVNAINAKYELLFTKLGQDFNIMFIQGLQDIGKDITSTDMDSLYNFGEDSYFTFKKGFTDKFIEEGYRGFFDVFKAEETDPYFPFIDLLKFESELELETEEENKKKSIAKRQEKLDAILNLTSSGLTAINDVLSAQAEMEIAIETNKTNAINDQLKARLANEQLSADERDRINQEISRNEAALVAKQNEINKKRFEQQKAFSIAMAVIDTFVAANQALRDETLVSTFVKIAAMVSIIGTGLANVASIAKQKFTGRAMPSPNLSGIGGAGGGAAEPVFNVVGASSQNQLAQAIAAQNAAPIKTYVVSSDVSTAQELDRKIVEGASI